ncbi:sensor histidine kinase [Paenibacillus athensensis]|uniref:Uncharacterized protein n=1 Tax=Paenibacillus athensensis TaxID=1967502 RepID=A0A4Y8Q0Q9_9BACL|nr:sensor histidine kinase [Paenibacillus athensensis]MCD1261390.1 sensor histidine kinase [Paenibacillus athensensis]
MKIENYNRNRILIQNLKNLLVIILLPLVILGSLSIFITQRYIKDEVNKNNEILLKQASDKIDLIIAELDTLSLNFSVNPNTIVPLKRIFNQPTLTYDDNNIFTIIKSYIESSSHVKPYIHSIFIYYKNDQNRLISSIGMGLVDLQNIYETAWYKSFIANPSTQGIWSEVGFLQEDMLGRQEKVLTLYKNLFTAGVDESDGVIMLNIKTDYMEQILNSAASYPDQGLVVINEKGVPIVANNIPSSIRSGDIANFQKDNRPFFTYNANGKAYTISKYGSEKYSWNYLSIMPNNVLFEVPQKLLEISVALLIASLLLGVLLAVYETRHNYLSFMKIIKILNSAREGETIPSAISRVKDEHGYLIQSIIKTFIEQNYLKMQLSERKYKMKVMEMLALQAQINPHFLYNTLNTISWKSIALTKKPNEVSSMIENLSTILKYSLSNSNQTVTVEEEIYYTKCYLDIQSVRYRNQFEVRWEYKEDIKHLHIMKLLLQPLIENSIYHGIKEKEGPGTIVIKLVMDRPYLKIWLLDDGLGIPPERLSEIRTMLRKEEDYTKTEHIGLFNVNKRLILTYGEDYGVKIRSVYRKGTAIYIRIPIDSFIEMNQEAAEKYQEALARNHYF